MPSVSDGVSLFPVSSQPYLQAILLFYLLILFVFLTIITTLRIISINSWNLKTIAFSKSLLVIALINSTCYVASAILSVYGMDPSLKVAYCDAADLVCIYTYFIAKIFMWWYLLERLYVVHCPESVTWGKWTERFKSGWYLGGILMLLIWLGGMISQVIGRGFELTAHGRCNIGMQLYAAYSWLVIEIVTHVYLTIGFVIPLCRAKFIQARPLARRAVIAAAIGFFASFANIVTAPIFKMNHFVIYTCVCLCSTDITVNVAALFWLSRCKQETEAQLQTRTVSPQSIERPKEEQDNEEVGFSQVVRSEV